MLQYNYGLRVASWGCTAEGGAAPMLEVELFHLRSHFLHKYHFNFTMFNHRESVAHSMSHKEGKKPAVSLNNVFDDLSADYFNDKDENEHENVFLFLFRLILLAMKI